MLPRHQATGTSPTPQGRSRPFQLFGSLASLTLASSGCASALTRLVPSHSSPRLSCHPASPPQGLDLFGAGVCRSTGTPAPRSPHDKHLLSSAAEKEPGWVP